MQLLDGSLMIVDLLFILLSTARALRLRVTARGGLASAHALASVANCRNFRPVRSRNPVINKGRPVQEHERTV
jgi:hypothetical protein